MNPEHAVSYSRRRIIRRQKIQGYCRYLRSRPRRTPGLFRGAFLVRDDFDDELPADFLLDDHNE